MKADNKPDRKGPPTRILIVFGVIAACFVVGLLAYKGYTRTHISTDDAFVDGRIHTIAAKINGTVKAVDVTDNQLVKKGDLLLEIDSADYDVRVDEAGAALSSERSRLSEMGTRATITKSQLEEMTRQAEGARVNLEVQQKNLAQADQEIRKAAAGLQAQAARLRQAEQDVRRADNLFRQEAISREKHENAETARDVAAAQVEVAREQLSEAETARDAQGARVRQAEIDIKRTEAALTTQRNVIRQAETVIHSQGALAKQREASLRTAELNRSYTRICAPVDGYVSKRSVEVGNQVQAGQPLLALVPLEGTWITANYKETQLARVKPGQEVKIEVDTYPGKTFRGKVESIMAGTGSAFSLFPPENATGNYVKVVQRVPVKIALAQGTDPRHLLRVGMSVTPTIIAE
jgi:membrane fusion protein, multidrug efflux system